MLATNNQRTPFPPQKHTSRHTAKHIKMKTSLGISGEAAFVTDFQASQKITSKIIAKVRVGALSTANTAKPIARAADELVNMLITTGTVVKSSMQKNRTSLSGTSCCASACNMFTSPAAEKMALHYTVQ